MMQVLIPMSGQGTRYKKMGYHQPKPLIPVSGRPMIERLLEKFPIDWPTTFVMAENHRETELPTVLKKLRPLGQLLYVPVHDKGPGFAIEQSIPTLNKNLPVLISYCDFGFKWDPWDFENFVRKSECHAALISYRGFHAHYLSPTKYAYSKVIGDKVVEVKEKGSFTDHRENEFASAGAYYFDSVETLSHSISEQNRLNLSFNGETYTSLTVEALLRTKKNPNVRIYEIPAFYQWGTPEDLKVFEYWEKTFDGWLKFQNKMKVDHVHMPMAGLGSRFKNYYETPKPFLKIDGIQMYQLALKSLPQGNSTSFITLDTAKKWIHENQDNFSFLNETPPGQAFSVSAALAKIPNEGEILISACDHSIVIDPELWEKFRLNPHCDSAIFTVKGFPGSQRRPNAFAYVKVQEIQNEFSLVSNVSVKRPISESPLDDHLLVGSFWFKNKEILKKYLDRLIEKNELVNGEIYLDSIFNLMIEDNLKVRNIPLYGYVNWGDPDSLAEALYWKEVFTGHRISIRQRLEGVEE